MLENPIFWLHWNLKKMEFSFADKFSIVFL